MAEVSTVAHDGGKEFLLSVNMSAFRSERVLRWVHSSRKTYYRIDVTITGRFIDAKILNI